MLRRHTWYLGIDVESCCIFNTKCVKYYELVN